MNKKAKGVTLVELVIAIAIISVSLFSILSIFKLSVTNSSDPMVKKQSVLIAEGLMEEVLSKSFSKPTGGFSGAITTANRGMFDTVTDYNGLTINGISNILGSSVSGLGNYSASISVVAQGFGTINSANSYLVTINVTGQGSTFTLKSYRFNTDN